MEGLAVSPVPSHLIRGYVETLRQNDTGVTQAILFGSHARWDADDESDINVAIISPDLGRDRLEEGVRLKLLTERVDTSISSRTRSVARGKRATSALPNLAWAGWGRCYLCGCSPSSSMSS